MKKRLNLTDNFLKGLRAGATEEEYADSKVSGLRVRVRRNGAITFFVRRSISGKQQRYTIGPYPLISLHDARQQAAAAIASFYRGENPNDHRLGPVNNKAETFEFVSAAYIEACQSGAYFGRGKPKRASTIAKEQTYLTGVLLPLIGEKRVTEYSRRDYVELRDELSKRSISAARHGCTVVRQILSYCVDHEIIQSNVALGVRIPKQGMKETVFSDADLEQLIDALLTGYVNRTPLRGSPIVRLAVLAALVSGRRGCEIAAMSKNEIENNRTWTIPANRMKAGIAFATPISPILSWVLDTAQSTDGSGNQYIFQSGTGHITRDSMTRMVSQISRGIGASGSLHDLRRTMATYLASTGEVPRFVTSKILAHSNDSGGGSALTNIYDRHNYHQEMLDAYAIWEAHLTELGLNLSRLEA